MELLRSPPLILSVLALLIALVALVFALRPTGSRRAEATIPSEPPPQPAAQTGWQAPLSQLDQRIAKLERQSCAEVVERTSPPVDRARDTARGGLGALSTTAAAGKIFAPGSPGSGSRHTSSAWLASFLAEYGRLVEEGGSALDAFINRYKPSGVVAEPGGDGFTLVQDFESSMLWAVPGEGDSHALVPGSRAINNWSTHFAPSRRTTAEEQLGMAFELAPDSPRFAVREPAWLQPQGAKRLTLVRKGLLDGFLN